MWKVRQTPMIPVVCKALTVMLILDRRIIGLVATQKLYDPATGQWQQKTTYTYDSTTVNSQATTAPGHDQSYDATVTVRGNVRNAVQIPCATNAAAGT